MNSAADISFLKKTLTLAKKFPQYNFREYFVRKVKDDLELAKAGKYTGDSQATMEQMKRMVTINSLYAKDSPLVIERQKEEKTDK